MSLLVVPLARERLYKKPGLPVKNYPRSASLGLMSEHDRRVADDEKTVGFPSAPSTVSSPRGEDSESRSPRRPLKRTYAQAGM